MWKIVEAEDGPLSAEDLMVLSVLLADAARRAARRTPHGIGREREVWEKLQPVLHEAHGWTPRGRDQTAGAAAEEDQPAVPGAAPGSPAG